MAALPGNKRAAKMAALPVEKRRKPAAKMAALPVEKKAAAKMAAGSQWKNKAALQKGKQEERPHAGQRTFPGRRATRRSRARA